MLRQRRLFKGRTHFRTTSMTLIILHLMHLELHFAFRNVITLNHGEVMFMTAFE